MGYSHELHEEHEFFNFTNDYQLRIINYEDKDEIGQRISANLHEF